MPYSDYARNKILDHETGTTSWTIPGGSFVKLHIGDPGINCTANPATETTRKSITWAAASSGTHATNAQAQWTVYPANETITHVSMWDAVSAGNPIKYGTLTSSVAVSIGGTLTISSGQLTDSLS
jgi:hypothetical protein